MSESNEFLRDRTWQIVLAATVGCAFRLSALPFFTLGRYLVRAAAVAP